MLLVKRAENNLYRLSIYVDDMAESPREWDNLGTMVHGHRRYNLGDYEMWNTELYSSYDEWLEGEILSEYNEDEVVVLPLYIYDHSGVTMNTSGFRCPWDSGQVGWIYVTPDKIRGEYGEVNLDNLIRAEKVLESEIKEFDNFLRGDVYGFVVEKKIQCNECGHVEYEHIDSCWGFYGDIDESGIFDEIPEEVSDLVEELKGVIV